MEYDWDDNDVVQCYYFIGKEPKRFSTVSNVSIICNILTHFDVEQTYLSLAPSSWPF